MGAYRVGVCARGELVSGGNKASQNRGLPVSLSVYWDMYCFRVWLLCFPLSARVVEDYDYLYSYNTLTK